MSLLDCPPSAAPRRTLPCTWRCSRTLLAHGCAVRATRRTLRLRRPLTPPCIHCCSRTILRSSLWRSDSSCSSTPSRHSSKAPKPCGMRRAMPRSIHTVVRDSRSRNRRSWLMSTTADSCAAILLFQPFDSRQIEMVGRLVEQEHVGLGASTRASAARFSSPPERWAGSASAARSELVQQGAGAIRIVQRGQGRIRRMPGPCRGPTRPALG